MIPLQPRKAGQPPTGHSSPGRLRPPLPRAVGIDRSFGVGPPGETRAGRILTVILSMAHEGGPGEVAAGVETEEHLALFRTKGRDSAQGFSPGRPE